MILSGEVRCWSLLGSKGYTKAFPICTRKAVSSTPPLFVLRKRWTEVRAQFETSPPSPKIGLLPKMWLTYSFTAITRLLWNEQNFPNISSMWQLSLIYSLSVFDRNKKKTAGIQCGCVNNIPGQALVSLSFLRSSFQMR